MAAEKHRLTFISYSRANKDFALELARELRSSGFLIWLDQLDIPTGARWDDEVEKALNQCEIFLVILTPRSIASNNVKDEIGYAIDSNKRILPVLLENATVPFRLRRFQYVDFTSKTYEEGIESAKQLLQSLLNEPATPNTESTTGVQHTEARMRIERISSRIPPESQYTPGPSDAQMVRRQAPITPKSVPIPVKPAPPQKQPQKPLSTTFLLLMGGAVLSTICLAAAWFAVPSFLKPVAQAPVSSPLPNPVDTEKLFATETPAPVKSQTNLTLTPTATFFTPTTIPTTVVPPSVPTTLVPTITPTQTIPSDPAQFIYFYFENINNRNYDLTWSLLSDQYKAAKNPSGVGQYIDFWNAYSKVDIAFLEYTYLTNTSAKVNLEAVFYKGGTSSTSKLTFYLTSDNPQGSWLFVNAPSTGGSVSDTTCSAAEKRLRVGINAQVMTATDPLLLREQPSDGRVVEQMPPGTVVAVIDGPTCAVYRSTYFWWWKVQTTSGNVGWVVEGTDPLDPVFIEPID
jgi:hypothetical protein